MILVKFLAGVVLSEKIGLKSVIFPRDTFENFPVSGIMRWAYGTGCVGVVNRPDHFAPALHTRIVLMVWVVALLFAVDSFNLITIVWRRFLAVSEPVRICHEWLYNGRELQLHWPCFSNWIKAEVILLSYQVQASGLYNNSVLLLTYLLFNDIQIIQLLFTSSVNNITLKKNWFLVVLFTDSILLPNKQSIEHVLHIHNLKSEAIVLLWTFLKTCK